jgi:hypothetical protein
VKYQVIIAASGANTNWDYIERISPAIPLLQAIKDSVEGSINQNRRYKAHTTRDEERDIKMLMSHYVQGHIYEHSPGRSKNHSVENFIAVGAQKQGFDAFFNKWWTGRQRERSVNEDYTSADA